MKTSAGRTAERSAAELGCTSVDLAGLREELSATVHDPAAIPSPERSRKFFEKEWVRSLFRALREDCANCAWPREPGKPPVTCVESYDLRRQQTNHLRAAFEGIWNSSERTWTKTPGVGATASVERSLSNRLRELCATEEESRREARAVSCAGIRNEIPSNAATRKIARRRGGGPRISHGRVPFARSIARGGMGVVYDAEDQNLKIAWRLCVLKVLDVPGTDGDLAKTAASAKTARVAALEHPASCTFRWGITLEDGRVVSP